MSDFVIYHNPKCRNSNNTLAILRDHGIEPTIVEYIQTPPSEETLRDLVKKLGVHPKEIVRVAENSLLNLPDSEDEDELISRLHNHPEILQRPIVANADEARVCRPPETVLEILPA